MSKYFGTDGIRGKNEKFSEDFVNNLGNAFAKYLYDKTKKPKIVIGGDTRESTKLIKEILNKNLLNNGIDIIDVGIIPTPAISFLTSYFRADSSIMITASHNPPTDNGIKILNENGEKMDDFSIDEIETYMDIEAVVNNECKGFLYESIDKAQGAYIDHLIKTIPCSLKGLSIGLDCANGATSSVAKTLFEKKGADITMINNDGNYGTKINNKCGSTYLDKIRDLVLKNKLDFGAAFDGDGDRCLFIDNEGNEVDGDETVAIISNYLKNKGELVSNKVVSTVMANQGLINYAKKNDIELIATSVGDSFVYAEMKKQNIEIGGEQSGHIIMPNQKTGDGLLTSLFLASIMKEKNKKLSELSKVMTKSPQIIVNIGADTLDKENFKIDKEIKKILKEYDTKIKKEQGRILVRPSGTESLIRVTIWGNDKNTIENISNEISKTIKERLNCLRK